MALMWRLNQISRTYSFESTKVSIWFGECKMRRLNQALETNVKSLAWLKRIFSENDGTWKNYLHLELKCYGGSILFHCSNYNARQCSEFCKSTSFQLKIKEAIHMQRKQPSLNQQLHRVNLKQSFKFVLIYTQIVARWNLIQTNVRPRES